LFDCDIFFFPFYGEGMPISVLEAMAFSMPVITRNVGGIKDFFINGEMVSLDTVLIFRRKYSRSTLWTFKNTVLNIHMEIGKRELIIVR
jgi:glycosyltransferase involved in cell wall biosynthesis